MIYLILGLILIIIIMGVILYFKSSTMEVEKLKVIKKDIKIKEEQLIIAKAERDNAQEEIEILNTNIDKVIEDIKDDEILNRKLDNIKSSYRKHKL